ncbi:hypothetical protein BDR03DRAFT_1018596 [Suillus americanus]|nr:hypothetical protein BDR03DRAFT_1018596 [Suillus americanus]
MSPAMPQQIFCDVKAHDAQSTKDLLAHAVSLDIEDNIQLFAIAGIAEKVKVSPLCLDALRVVIRQFRLHQRLATELTALPPSDIINPHVVFYISLLKYYKDLLSAFHAEVQADPLSSTSKWRSSHLDFHIALALMKSTFIPVEQRAALKVMNRTWKHFLDKKIYEPVRELDGQGMHAAFCSDGDDMCGGSFEHTVSDDQVISDFIKDVTSAGVGGDTTEHGDSAAHPGDSAARVSSTTEDPECLQASSDIILVDMDDRASASRPAPKGNGKRRKKAAGTRKSKKKTVAATGTDDQSAADEIASHFESNLDMKKDVKERRQPRKPRTSKAHGKRKAPVSPSVESGDDDVEIVAVNLSVPLELKTTAKLRRTVESDVEGCDDVILPSIQDGWEAWTKIAFEDGNGQVFLRFATWMLVRFRQVTGVDMEEPINGVVIPCNPRLLEGNSDDDYFEALGMERLYSAIVHLETSPRYMCHLLHALGKVIDQSDAGASNPQFQPCKSPPTVTAPMMKDMTFPWLTLRTTPEMELTDTEDAEGSIDGNAMDVTDAMDCMILDEGSASGKHALRAGDLKPSKRKRTSSQASPPKKDGGRGPVKRRKNISDETIQSASPGQTESDIDDFGLLTSPPS